ncbi:ROK family protein [Cohnella sp. JJ-181]|uniref:ROK family protein n=1 Tax=Cohnella rhizoplanae TaxID=2974897 RepID=UPI0022FFB9DC|nr:ROK family protein [Cohnella sp. JJ-181]CAI6080132.1 Glucokinase [Cohnella sp. JJ-181]
MEKAWRTGTAFIGADIGGTNTVIGLFDEQGSPIGERRIATMRSDPRRPTSEPAAFMDRLALEIGALALEHGYRDIAAAGFGVPGWVDTAAGMALDASNMGWRNVRFAEEMSRRLGAPVYIDNDVRLYTLGEAAAGAGAGCANLVCITVGTGLSAGIMMDGALLRGSRLLAGEIGHDRVDGLDSPCNCGKRGCLETIASAPGIARLATEAVQSGKRTSLADLDRPITALDVYLACDAGDAVAADIFSFAGRTLGRKLAALALAVDPQVIIVGGGVAAAGDYLLQPVRDELAAHIPEAEWRPSVVPGKLQDKAGLVGAVRFAIGKWRQERGNEHAQSS